MVRVWHSICVIVCLAWSWAASADTVTLSSPSGGLALTGELLAFDGRFYRIKTDFGDMTVAGEKVVCTGAACPGDGETTGFTLVAPVDLSHAVLPALIHLFAAEQGLTTKAGPETADGLTFTLSRPGHARSFPVTVRHAPAKPAYAALAAGQADMILTTRAAHDNERAALRAAGLGDPTDPRQALLLAYDALVLAEPFPAQVKPLQVETLTRLVHRPAPGALHARRGTADFDRLLGRLNATAPDGIVLHDGATALSQALTAAGRGIGVTLRSRQTGLRARPLQGDCGMTLYPDRADLLTGAYPFRMPILAVVPARRLPRDMIPFIAFLQSDRAGAVLRRSGFVRPSAQPVEMPRLGDRFFWVLADQPRPRIDPTALPILARSLAQSRRLGLSFPTAPGAELNLIYTASLDLLVDAIARGDFAGQTLTFYGFDTSADPEDSHEDANALRDAVRARFTDGLPGDLRIEVSGFGDVLPLTCRDGPWVREINRRVEVWLRD